MSKYMKRGPISIREMQIKNAMWYQYIPIRVTAIKKTENNKCWQGYGKIGALVHGW